MKQGEGTPTTVQVACVQFQPVIGDVEANLAAMAKLVRGAAKRGAQVIVVPELSDTGYVFESLDEVARLASPIPGGASAQFLMSLARELGVYVACGLCEATEDGFYNSAILCGPEGYLGTYRKLHLWDRETLFFRPGDLGLPVFDTPLGRIGLAICYDGWFPETFRTLALNGADLVCVPTNWVPMPSQPPGAEPMANTLHKAAAHVNGITIACADRIGTERGQPFLGQSLIVGPQGWPLAGPASAEGEETLFATVSMGESLRHRAVSARNDVFADRRTDIYG